MLAGFDTTAMTLSCCCFNLAIHPEIQEKLYDSVIAQIQKHVRLDKLILNNNCWIVSIWLALRGRYPMKWFKNYLI